MSLLCAALGVEWLDTDTQTHTHTHTHTHTRTHTNVPRDVAFTGLRRDS